MPKSPNGGYESGSPYALAVTITPPTICHLTYGYVIAFPHEAPFNVSISKQDVINRLHLAGLTTEEEMSTSAVFCKIHADVARLQKEAARVKLPVWKHFEDGCSVRLLCPQKFSDKMWKMLSILEEEWGCMAGSNTYLTPKGTQGFAPHYDDIEAFLLQVRLDVHMLNAFDRSYPFVCSQVEGKKLWKVYAPLSDDETLPRVSSRNFAQDEIGKPVLDITLEQGDLLYFPRGFIHQAQSPDDVDSLHVTVSTGQQNSIGNFLETILPQALAGAIASNLDLRKSLPRDYLGYMGVMYSDLEGDTCREAFLLKKHMR
ncbi:hypothetical protein DYB32_010776, partial [Aphanomyces invadans]